MSCGVNIGGKTYRGLIYGIVGWVVDRAFTTTTGSIRSGRVETPTAGLVLIPVYALALPLFEPTHNAVRTAPTAFRASLYGLGFIAAEYAIGRSLRLLLGRAPWDYTGSRWSVGGFTRLDYLPLWAIAGLALEPLHDRIMPRSTSADRQRVSGRAPRR